MDKVLADAVYNVRDFGAVCDGKYDDTKAIQEAFNAAKGGGYIYFPSGKYLVTKTIFINNDNLKIYGQGRSSYIIYTYEQKENDT